MPTGLTEYGLPQHRQCECCAPKMRTATVTIGRKWTKKEITEEVLYLADALSNARWWNRATLLRSLKHWNGKLQALTYP